MPKAEPDKIPIATLSDLRSEGEALQAVLALNETEDTWEKINRALKRFQAVVRGGAATRFTDDFVALLRDPRTAKPLVRSIVTERGALSGTALELVASCTRLGPSFEPLLPIYLPPILRLFGRPNKVYTTRSAATVASIVKNTRLAKPLQYLVVEWRAEAGKSASFREHAAATVALMLGTDAGALAVDKDALERRIEDLEWVIKTGATGREPSVRSDMKKCWLVYKREWPERVHAFTAPMSPTTRKYLKVDMLSSSTSAAPPTAATAAGHPPAGPAAAPPIRRAAHPHPPPASTTHGVLSSSSHAGPSRAGPSSRSHGPTSAAATLAASSSSSSSSNRAHHLHASHAAPHALSSQHHHAKSTSNSAAPPSLGMGPPTLRSSTRSAADPAAVRSHTRTVSGSTTASSSSRSASRTEARPPTTEPTPKATTAGPHDGLQNLASSTGGGGSSTRMGFKPIAHGAAAKSTGSTTTTGNSRPAGRALMTSSSANTNTLVSGASGNSNVVAEPRKARRVAVVPLPITSTASSSTTTTTTATTAALAPPPPALTSSVSSSSLTAAATATSGSGSGMGSAAAPPPILARSHSSSTSSSASHARSHGARDVSVPAAVAAGSVAQSSAAAPAASITPAAAAALGPSHAPFRPTRRAQNASGTTTSTAARARPGVAPSAATLASRERRAARERERERKQAAEASSAAATATAAGRRRRADATTTPAVEGGEEEEEKRQLEMRKREELKEVARRVPLPPPAPEEEAGEEGDKAPGAIVETPAAAAVPAGTKGEEQQQQQQPAVDVVPAAETRAAPAPATATAEREVPPESNAPLEATAAAAAVVIADAPIQADAPETVSTRAPSPEPAPKVEPGKEQEHHDERSPEVASDDHFAGVATEEEEESARQPGAEEPSFAAEPADADPVHSGDHISEAEAAQHDVEESVGMDSDYLVESQGTEADAPSSAQDAAADEPDRRIEQIDLSLPGNVEEQDAIAATIEELQPVEAERDTSLQHDGPGKAEQQEVCNTPMTEQAILPEEDDNAAEHDDESAPEEEETPEPDDEEEDLPSRRYDELPPSPLLSHATPARTASVKATPSAPASPVPPSSNLATPTRAAPPQSSTHPVAYYPSPSPGPISRHDAPFTPMSRGVPVRFPLAAMPHSPEPFQTRSIILDTPRRFEQYAPVRLPQRAAAPQAAEVEQPEGAASVEEVHAPELPMDESLDEASFAAAQSFRRGDQSRSAPPLDRAETFAYEANDVAAPPEHPQNRLTEDVADLVADADAETSFDDDVDGEDQPSGQSAASEMDRTVEPDADIESSGETDEPTEYDAGSSSEEEQQAAHVPSSYDDSAVDAAAVERAEESVADLTAHDDSSALTELAPSPVASVVAAPRADAEDETEEDTDEEEEEEPVNAPASPAGTTLDFSDFNAPPSTSTPSTQGRRPFWDQSLLGDESANFELEQPGLRFHDETESEHSMASTLLGDFDISGRGPTRAFSSHRQVEAERPAIEEAPSVLQRSLRSRVVTVDQANSTSKTPARSTRSAAATNGRRDALMELQQ